MSVWPNALESLTATLNKFQGQTYYCFGPGAYLGILQVKIGLLRGGGHGPMPANGMWQDAIVAMYVHILSQFLQEFTYGCPNVHVWLD